MLNVTEPRVPETIQRHIEIVVAEAKGLVVDDEISNSRAAELLTGLKKASDDLDAARTALVKPLNDTVKNINTMFRAPASFIDGAIQHLKGGITGYLSEKRRVAAELARAEQAREQADLMARAAEAEERGDAVSAEHLVAKAESVKAVSRIPSKTTVTEFGGVTVRQIWKFEITDPARVPAQYLTVDEKLIRKAVNDGVYSIPGVRIYQDDSVAVR